ncbi:MAG: PKD domain-containing protein [Bacteroidales bacterium]|nr:PKD domain-containing protein [Bacteroidales bacterium]
MRLKEAGGDNLIEELFRHKLEDAELMPSPSVRAKLMRRMAIKEFLRFNPARFNIYYLIGILSAVSIAVIMLTSESDAPENTGDKAPYSDGSSVQKPQSFPSDRKEEFLSLSASKSSSEYYIRTSGSINDRSVNRVTENVPGEVLTEAPGKIRYISEFKPEIDLCEAVKSSQHNLRIIESNSVNPKADIEASLVSGCAPLLVRFNMPEMEYDSCLWSFGDGEFSSESNPVKVYTREGEYSATLRVFDKNGLETNSGSTTITVHPRPLARFEIHNDDGNNGQALRFINLSNNAVRFRWDFGDGTYSELFEPDHTYQTSGNYSIRLIAISEHGCSDSVKITGSAGGSGYFIDFPNAFMPNPGGPSSGYYSPSSDESSAIFHPVASGVAEYQLRIFSRRGILIFESNDINIGWDGYIKGQMCEPGVYVWKASGRYLNGESFTKIGDVTILKGSR